MTDKPKTLDEINARGKHGAGTDPTPDDHYSVTGVLAGKPTPETDPQLRDEVRDLLWEQL